MQHLLRNAYAEPSSSSCSHVPILVFLLLCFSCLVLLYVGQAVPHTNVSIENVFLRFLLFLMFLVLGAKVEP